LADFGIARDYSSRRVWIDHTASRYDESKRLKTALIHRDVGTHQCAEHIQDNGTTNRQRCVVVPFILRRGSRKIDSRSSLCFMDADRNSDLVATIELASVQVITSLAFTNSAEPGDLGNLR
jgi:hypothetical protein